MYEAAAWVQKYAKSFKIFVFSDHKNNTFRSTIQPSKRISKKLLKMVIEMEPMNLERVWVAGSDNILGDAPSRSPADREVARNIPIPMDLIQNILHQLFWAPDEMAGDTAKRVQELGIINPGVLSYLPEDLAATSKLPNDARLEDELQEPRRAFSVDDVEGLPEPREEGGETGRSGNPEPAECEIGVGDPDRILTVPTADLVCGLISREGEDSDERPAQGVDRRQVTVGPNAMTSTWGGMLYTKDVFPVWLSDVESKRHRSRYRQVPEEFYTVTGHRVVTPDNVTDFLAGHCGLGIKWDLQEQFSGSGRVSAVAEQAGLATLFPIDLRYGWDLRVQGHRDKLDMVREVLQPLVKFSAPECRLWSCASNSRTDQDSMTLDRETEEEMLTWLWK